jgi:hypothetical protein
MFILNYICVCFDISICQQFHICGSERPSKVMVGIDVLREVPHKHLFLSLSLSLFPLENVDMW